MKVREYLKVDEKLHKGSRYLQYRIYIYMTLYPPPQRTAEWRRGSALGP